MCWTKYIKISVLSFVFICVLSLTHTHTLFPPSCFHGAPMRSTSVFYDYSARVPGINRQMLPSTCPLTLLLNGALAHTQQNMMQLTVKEYKHQPAH